MRSRYIVSKNRDGSPIEIGTRVRVDISSGLVVLTFPDVKYLTLILEESDLIDLLDKVKANKEIPCGFTK